MGARSKIAALFRRMSIPPPQSAAALTPASIEAWSVTSIVTPMVRSPSLAAASGAPPTSAIATRAPSAQVGLDEGQPDAARAPGDKGGLACKSHIASPFASKR